MPKSMTGALGVIGVLWVCAAIFFINASEHFINQAVKQGEEQVEAHRQLAFGRKPHPSGGCDVIACWRKP